MKNVWRKLRDNWLDFWEDDELDMGKKHLSQHDKRSLLYGGFMIGAVTFAFISISIMIGNVWTTAMVVPTAPMLSVCSGKKRETPVKEVEIYDTTYIQRI